MFRLKDGLLKLVQSLPDDCTIDDFYHRLYVFEKLTRGMAAAEAGLEVSIEEAERRMDSWLSSPTPE